MDAPLLLGPSLPPGRIPQPWELGFPWSPGVSPEATGASCARTLAGPAGTHPSRRRSSDLRRRRSRGGEGAGLPLASASSVTLLLELLPRLTGRCLPPSKWERGPAPAACVSKGCHLGLEEPASGARVLQRDVSQGASADLPSPARLPVVLEPSLGNREVG